MNISAVILTNNRDGDLKRTLRSVEFCDDILIVEDTSAGKLMDSSRFPKKVRVVTRELKGDFASQRNFALTNSNNEWVLFVDDDEEVTSGLKEELKQFTAPSSDAYFIRRRDFFWGRELKYGETRKARRQGLIRLVKKGSGKWKGKVHEEFVTKSPVGQLRSFLNHYPHPTVGSFLTSVNEYSTLRARELRTEEKKVPDMALLYMPLGKFLYTYFFLFGFLDGPAGFAYSFFMSFHSFLVRAKCIQYEEIGSDS